MKVEISNSALKFLNKLDNKNKESIIHKIGIIKNSIEDTGVIPFKSLDIKVLKGNWYPYKRLRVGDFRIIFNIEINNLVLKIYEIDSRGNIY